MTTRRLRIVLTSIALLTAGCSGANDTPPTGAAPETETPASGGGDAVDGSGCVGAIASPGSGVFQLAGDGSFLAAAGDREHIRLYGPSSDSWRAVEPPPPFIADGTVAMAIGASAESELLGSFLAPGDAAFLIVRGTDVDASWDTSGLVGGPNAPIGPRRLTADAAGQVIAAGLDLESGDGVVLEVNESSIVEVARLRAAEGEQVFIEAVIASSAGAPLVVGGWRLPTEGPPDAFVAEISSEGIVELTTMDGRRILGGMRLNASSILLVGDEPEEREFASFAVRLTDGRAEGVDLDELGVPATGLADVAPYESGAVFLAVDTESLDATATTVCSEALAEWGARRSSDASVDGGGFAS